MGNTWYYSIGNKMIKIIFFHL